MIANPARSRSGGFTLVEVLMVVAIIGLIFSIAFPLYGRMVKSAHRKAFAADANLFYGALKQYYIDNGRFPSDFGGPPDRLFNKATLSPLTTDGYLPTGSARSFLERQTSGAIDTYLAISFTGVDSDLLIAMEPEYDDQEYIYIFYTRLLEDDYGALDGVYFWQDGELVPVDQVVD